MVMKSLIPWKREEERNDLVQYSDDPLWQMRNRMNQLFRSFYDEPFSMDLFQEDDIFSPRIDLSETEKEYTVVVDLPGLDENDIDLSYSRNILSICGAKQQEKEEKGRQYHRIERYSGQFQRDIPLQEEIDEENIEALFKNGVLTIHLPKMEDSTQKKKISIKKNK